MVPTKHLKRPESWVNKVRTWPESVKYQQPGKIENRDSAQVIRSRSALHKARKYTKYTGQLNTSQEFLYYRALYGLDMYTPEEIKDMKREKRRKIQRAQRKAREIIEMWKQDMLNTITNDLFSRLFPNSQFTRELLETSTTLDANFQSNLSLRSIGVTDVELASLLVKHKALPGNFHQIKPPTVCKHNSSLTGKQA